MQSAAMQILLTETTDPNGMLRMQSTMIAYAPEQHQSKIPAQRTDATKFVVDICCGMISFAATRLRSMTDNEHHGWFPHNEREHEGVIGVRSSQVTLNRCF